LADATLDNATLKDIAPGKPVQNAFIESLKADCASC
jgi:hypothetical protein